MYTKLVLNLFSLLYHRKNVGLGSQSMAEMREVMVLTLVSDMPGVILLK